MAAVATEKKRDAEKKRKNAEPEIFDDALESPGGRRRKGALDHGECRLVYSPRKRIYHRRVHILRDHGARYVEGAPERARRRGLQDGEEPGGHHGGQREGG